MAAASSRLQRLERVGLTLTRALSVVGLVALMALAAMTLADGLARWLANRPIEGVRDAGALIVAVAVACCIPVGYPRGRFGPVSRSDVRTMIHWDRYRA